MSVPVLGFLFLSPIVFLFFPLTITVMDKIDFRRALLKVGDHGGRGAESVGVVRAARVPTEGEYIFVYYKDF